MLCCGVSRCPMETTGTRQDWSTRILRGKGDRPESTCISLESYTQGSRIFERSGPANYFFWCILLVFFLLLFLTHGPIGNGAMDSVPLSRARAPMLRCGCKVHKKARGALNMSRLFLRLECGSDFDRVYCVYPRALYCSPRDR